MKKKAPGGVRPERLVKCRTGIRGLDEITSGGIPCGRPTLVCGAAGCGKTLMAAEFLVRGAAEFGEPGVFACFEENQEELAKNVASLGFDLNGLVRRGKLVVDHIQVERSEIEETGEYDLEGLFVRLDLAIKTIGAKRVVLDTLEALFAALPNEAILRAELRRLFRWLKERRVTAMITAERGREQLTRHGLEEYVSDCVIVLDHRVHQGIATRHLRIVKYRGSQHGTNEYPFLIGDEGITVLPITSLKLDHDVSDERVPSGLPRLDAMLGGEGYYRGSSILLTGTPGTGKTSLAAAFATSSAKAGERVLYFAFEESPAQIVRNMTSIGMRLEPLVKRGTLKFHAARPTLYGLETHLSTMIREVSDFKPSVVIVDPITSLIVAGSDMEAKSMATRLVDYLKGEGITSVYTSLTPAGEEMSVNEMSISSLMDTWLQVTDLESNGERNRGLSVIKSRGMAHSNQVRELLISDRGLDLVDAYIGPGGLLTGSARAAQAAREKAEALAGREEATRRRRAAARRRDEIGRQIAALRFEQENEAEELRRMSEEIHLRTKTARTARSEMARLRHAEEETAKASHNGPDANGERA